MGIAVSNWRLANAVARLGQLGVVSGVAIDSVLARRLQDGDPGGHMRRAMEHFPIPQVAAEALRRYFHPGGRAAGEAYTLLPMYQQEVSRSRDLFSVLASFVEVTLAKEGHAGLAGRDLLVSSRTGSGKTVAFGLCLAETLLGPEPTFGTAGPPRALVIAPTRELAMQVQRELAWLLGPAGARVDRKSVV